MLLIGIFTLLVAFARPSDGGGSISSVEDALQIEEEAWLLCHAAVLAFCRELFDPLITLGIALKLVGIRFEIELAPFRDGAGIDIEESKNLVAVDQQRVVEFAERGISRVQVARGRNRLAVQNRREQAHPGPFDLRFYLEPFEQSGNDIDVAGGAEHSDGFGDPRAG